MTKIIYPPLQRMADHYEALREAAEEYREFLLQRLAEYEARENPPNGLEIVTGNIGRVERFLELLEGEPFDALRAAVDGIGVLEAVEQGIWV